MEAQGERRYTSCSFMASALDGGEWSASPPATLYPRGKDPPVPIGQEAGWDPEPVWTQRIEEKSLCLCRRSNLDRPVVQSVARHYTDWATWFPFCPKCLLHSIHSFPCSNFAEEGHWKFNSRSANQETPRFYGTQKPIAVCTRTHHRSVSEATIELHSSRLIVVFCAHCLVMLRE
jgi:hypothetical protein